LPRLVNGEGGLGGAVVHELELDLLHVPLDGVAVLAVGLVMLVVPLNKQA
jgi:hypothetical protein